MSTNTVAVRTEQIPIDKITPSPFQVRQDFDAEKLKAFAQDIQDHGMLCAINVRPVGDHFELIAGERRWRAAKLLGWQTLEAKIEEVDDSEAAQCGLIENLQREDLSPIEQAKGFKMLSEAPINLSQSEIARMGGKDQSLINKYCAAVKLCDHPGGMNQFIPLTLKHLLELCRLSNLEDQAALADEAVKRDLSVGQLKYLVDQKLGKVKPHNPPPQPKSEKGGSNGGSGPSVEPDPEPQKDLVDTSRTPVSAPTQPTPKAVDTTPPAAPATDHGFMGTVLNAAGQDQLDRILPWWGRTGTIIRERFTLQWFKRHEAGAFIASLLALWFIWGIVEAIFPFVAAPFRWTWQHTFARPAVVASVPAPEPVSKPTLSSLSTVPAPTGLKAELIQGHRVRFSWNAVGPEYRYLLYSRLPGNSLFQKEMSEPTTKTTGVWTPYNNEKFEFVITAVDKEDRESAYSAPIEVDLR